MSQSKPIPADSQNPKPTPSQHHLLITVGIILLIEAPQVVSAWMTLAEKMPLFRATPTEVVQTQQKP